MSEEWKDRIEAIRQETRNSPEYQKIVERNKKIQELRAFTDSLYQAIISLGGVDKAFLQFYEGAITLAELNLLFLENLHLINQLGRALEEISFLEKPNG